jgi:hypothetical protein
MTMLTNRPMSLFLVEFDELYARHLCRHSQLGINVIHLLALLGIWYALYGLLYWLVGMEWVLAAAALAYLATLVINVPIRVFLAAALFIALIVAAVVLLPQPPVWGYLIVVALLYKVQSWSHRFYTIETDMTVFNKKYAKGFVLFVVLLFYEVPIVLNFLLFDRKASAANVALSDQESTAANAS